jgi:Domain of unknown function (DUF4330)
MARWNPIDTGVTVTALCVALGITASQLGWHKTSGQVIKGETDIHYQIVIRNLKTLRPDILQAGKTLSITIRNQPRGDVKIVDVKHNVKRTLLQTPGKGAGFSVIDDPVDNYGHDFLVTLRDHAQITEDGYVTEGIKVKIGLPIEIEGFDYRVNGSIVNVEAATQSAPAKPAA